MRDPIKLILVRHGERGNEGNTGDERLSPRGRIQAESLAKVIKTSFPNWRPEVLASPKARAQETADAIALIFGSALKTSPLIDECRSGESPGQFSDRVANWLAEFEAKAFPRGIVAVSHSDWLEEAVAILLNNRIFLRWMPATAHLFELQDGKVIHSGLITV